MRDVFPSACVGLYCAWLATCAGPPCSEAPSEIDESVASPYDGYRSERYADEEGWLCRPDVEGDPCDDDLDVTRVQPDGTLEVIAHAAAQEPAADCFFVYPTVDLGLSPGVDSDPRAAGSVAAVAWAQAARLSESCAVYAPLYRQMKLGTYAEQADDETQARCFAIAYSDVKDAFLHFLGTLSDGRPFVLAGHSQGSHHLQHLMRELVDDDAALRERLVAALLVGGSVATEPGEDRGETFEQLPLCAGDDDTGCVIAFRSFAEGAPLSLPAGAALLPELRMSDDGRLACTTPSGGAGEARLSRTILRAGGALGASVAGVTTDWVQYDDLYASRCISDEEGHRFLEVSLAAEDERGDPVGVATDRWHGATGLHLFDYSLSLGDLLDTVRLRVAAMTSGSTGGR